jgi:chromosome segregation ATPase
MQEISRHNERLPVKLTEQDLRERGARLAQLEGDLAQHNAAMKSAQSTMAARKKEIESKIFQVAQTMRDGEELRDVLVACMMDEGKVLEIRLDTNTALGPAREPRPDEMQGRLFEVEPDDGGEEEAN